MKIVHYLLDLDSKHGGPQRSTRDLCVVLARTGHEVTLLTSRVADGPREWLEPVPGLPRIVELPWPGRLGQWYSGPQLREAERALRGADVVHFHGVWTPSNAQIGAVANRLGVRSVISLHGMLDDHCFEQKALKKRLYLWAGASRWLRGAAAVHCSAAEELRQSQRFFDPARGRVVPNILDLEPYRTLPGPELAHRRWPDLADASRPTLVFLGRLHPIKGLPALVDAGAELRRRGLNPRILLIGPDDTGHLDELQARARSRGVEQQLMPLGMITGELKLSLLQAACCFVLPSHHENFGLAIFEALLCGRPIVTTRGVKVYPELERSGAAVLVDAPARGDAVADAIVPLLNDRARADQMGVIGRRWAIDFLNPNRVLAQYEAMYRGDAAP